MKEVIWIFRNSAAGKETFINYVIENQKSFITDNFGLRDKEVKKSEISTKYIGQFEGDPITLKRDDIFKEVPTLLKSADAVLIKWQTVDSESSRVSKLLSKLPNAQHRIIQICTSKNELSKRLPLKSWWGNYDVSSFIDEENLHIQQWIDKLNNKIPITKVAGDSSAMYSLITT